MGAPTSGAETGTTARRNPSRAASASRRAVWPTSRSSPPRPISAQAITSLSSGTPGPMPGPGTRRGRSRLAKAETADHGRVDIVVGEWHAGPVGEDGDEQ